MAGNSAKPETKMKPKPSTMFSAPWSTGPAPSSLNSGNSTAPTTIIPATRQAARNPKRMTNRRPIRAMQSPSLRGAQATKQSRILPRTLDCFASLGMTTQTTSRAPPSVRHRHGAQRLPLARRQFLGLRLQLPAGGEDVAAARRAHRRGVAGVEDVFGEFFDLVPVRTFVGRARPRIERDQVDLGRNAVQELHQKFRIVERIVDAFQH